MKDISFQILDKELPDTVTVGSKIEMKIIQMEGKEVVLSIIGVQKTGAETYLPGKKSKEKHPGLGYASVKGSMSNEEIEAAQKSFFKEIASSGD